MITYVITAYQTEELGSKLSLNSNIISNCISNRAFDNPKSYIKLILSIFNSLKTKGR